MPDFTVDLYRTLLRSFIEKGYAFQTFSTFLENPREKGIILRHDVDARVENSLAFAKIQNSLGIRGTYYFRTVPGSFDKDIMKHISDLGHEIGYHYEDVDLVSSRVMRKDELIDKACESFRKNLEMFRRHFDIKTICMHGSPRGRYDNRLIWEKYDYKELGLIGEPYFDIDFNEMAYYTDTGRRWDGYAVSVRDRIMRHGSRITAQWPEYHSTGDIIEAVGRGVFPQKAMLTFHPQRWTNNPLLWMRELLAQNVKNQVKKIFYVR